MIDPELQDRAKACGLELREDEEGLFLCERPSDSGKNCSVKGRREKPETEILRGDFTKMIPRIRQSNLEKELLVRAAKLRKTSNPALNDQSGERFPIVLDATAGMGEDSLLLAAAGFRVELYEKDPVIAALLSDALERAGTVPELAGAAGRMHLHCGDSIAELRKIAEAFSGFPELLGPLSMGSAGAMSENESQESESEASVGTLGESTYEEEKREEKCIIPDIIYLDPMFPERTKSAKVKKKFQLLHGLEKPCENEEEMFAAAIAVKPKKVIVKRPVKGPYLAGRKPDYSYKGKAVRYDCYINV